MLTNARAELTLPKRRLLLTLTLTLTVTLTPNPSANPSPSQASSGSTTGQNSAARRWARRACGAPGRAGPPARCPNPNPNRP